MKKQLRSHVTALFLLAPVAAVMVALPTIVAAQPAPEVRSLEVAAEDGVEPGSRLSFTVVGTPRSIVNIRIRGLRERIPLRETARGVYTGRYVVRRSDDIDNDAEIRAILRSGNRTASADYTLGETLPRPPVAAPPPALRIDRFTVAAIDRIEPGAELRFTLEGAPGGTASIDLPGVTNDLALRETRPGHYEGNYTIRRADNLNPAQPVVGKLRIGDRFVIANLNPPLVQGPPDNRPPAIGNLSPREGEAVPAGPAVLISGNFDDRRGSGVDPASVRVLVSGRDVTRDTQVTPESFNVRAVLPPGRHTVDITARDQAGNVVRRAWSFDVVAAAPTNMPAQLNLGNNSTIDGNSTQVQGRGAPFATHNVRVDAVLPVPGGFNVAQQVFHENVSADANGNFVFPINPKRVIPGTRYEVTIISSKPNTQDHQAKWVFVQR